MREQPFSASLRLPLTSRMSTKPGTEPPVTQEQQLSVLQTSYKLVRSQAKELRQIFHLPYDCDYRLRKSAATYSSTRTYRYRKGTMPEASRIYVYNSSGDLPTVTTFPAPIPALDDGLLINNCYSQIKDLKFDVSIFLSEVQQTADLVKNAVTRIDNGLSAIAKKDFGRAAKILRMRKPRGASRSKHAADNLLAYQFGVLQLVNDVNGAIQGLHKAFNRLPLFSVQSGYDKPVETGLFEECWYPDQRYSHKHYVNHKVVGEERHQVTLSFKLDEAFWRNLQSFGLTNPANTLWQTRPLSFLAGWCVSVDAVLASFDALNGLEFISGSYMRGSFLKHYITYAGSWYSSDSNPNSWTTLQSSDVMAQRGEWDLVSLRRVVYTTMPPPEFRFKLPFSNDAVGKAVTSVAVFRQQLNNLSQGSN